MKFVLIVSLCSFIFAASALLTVIAIDILDGTDLMDAIVERIRGEK